VPEALGSPREPINFLAESSDFLVLFLFKLPQSTLRIFKPKRFASVLSHMGPKKFLRKSNQRLDWIGPIFEALFCFLHAFYPVVAVLSARLPLLACRDAGAPFFLDFFCLSPVQFFPNWKRGNKLKLNCFLSVVMYHKRP